MSYASLIRQIDAGTGLDYVEARNLGAALFDGGVPELETAAFLVALNQHDPGLDAWLGLHAALAERLPDFAAPPGAFRTVVLPAYHGVRAHPHLTPLLALLLKSFGIPVLIHGVLEGGGGTAAAYVLREIGIFPSTTVSQVNAALREEGIAFAPVALLNPGLAALLALRSRLGIDGWATRLAVLADLLGTASVRTVPAVDARELTSMRETLEALGGSAILLPGCEGEAFADPQRRPDMWLIQDGTSQRVYEAQSTASPVANLPATDARATGAWIAQTVSEALPLPLPVRNQLAVCLYAAGYTEDLNQARAITAINGFGRAAA
ncbi:MAG: DNA-binding protein YbiB [Hydrogenophilales bacterium 16-64-46]|nr:MAG: DNA-binding protein YbiB [Hydrogenophilales bacterium 12-64-13]OYZ07203.1 MAG: DNA-binding protein YbiB [Hydrogenophilales bacterium 16-64-46]OZA37329.1 MAG: DNA-binding protein YbiB [Hydrogenophilales bacterium 17-64-34]HQT00654.1 DNA-binding protein YbiB [Thiobacillus sp.]